MPSIEVTNVDGPCDSFVGRVAEHDILARLVDEAATGRPWAVLVEGGAGTGKSALLRCVHRGMEAFCALRLHCDAAEASLPFGLISQLKWHAHVPAECPLPDGGVATAEESPARVGAELLELLYAAQETRPIAVIIDDLHWADEASADAIAFVLRRLGDARVLTVLSARTGASEAENWSAGRGDVWRRLIDGREFGVRIRLGALTAPEVAELAQMTGHGPIPPAVADQLRRHTNGNPAYLRALLADLPTGCAAWLDRPLPLLAPAVDHVGLVMATLPEQSVRLAAALAVLDTRCALGTAGRVAGVADPVAALEPLLESGLVQWWPENPVTTVGLRVPAERDALCRLMTPSRRRDLHLAAVAVVRGDAAWAHRVAAASGPDPSLARELEAGAAACGSAGSGELAASMLLWAAGLSDDRYEYEKLLLTGAAQLIWCRSLSKAAALRESVAGCSPGPLRDLILAALEPAGNKADVLDAKLSDVLAAADRVPALRQATARAILALACRDVRSGDALVAAVARRVLTINDLDPTLAQLARCLLAEATGRLAGGQDAVLRELSGLGPAPSLAALTPADAILLWRRGVSFVATGQLNDAARDLSAALRSADANAFADADATLAYVQYLLGEWDAAGSTAERAAALALSHGTASTYAHACVVAACVAASRGDWVQAQGHIRGASLWPHSGDRASPAGCLAVAVATMAQARGDQAGVLAALDHPQVAEEFRHYRLWWRPLQVEALIAKGQLDEASAALSMLTAEADGAPCLRPGIGWLSGWLAYRQGDPVAARLRYEDALAAPGTSGDIPLLRARLEHSYGQLLLAQRNRRLATTWILRAHRRYAALGAKPYLERCAAGPSACGLPAGDQETARTRTVLSAQEYRVAHLVAQGLTNQEVASELYVSTKTVEYHLTNIFAKLDINSRRQLRARVSFGEAATEADSGVAELAAAQARRLALGTDGVAVRHLA